MMLLEHHAKALLRSPGVAVPEAVLVRAGDPLPPVAIAVVKAQVPVGGRGKAGGIRMVRNAADLPAAVAEILALTIKGHDVRAVRIETPVTFVHEAYFSLTLDAGRAEVTVMMSPHGGIEVEDEATRADLACQNVSFDPDAVRAAITRLAQSMPEALRAPMRDAGHRLTQAFFAQEALLLEINPLFVGADSRWTVGDAKLAIDENALPRLPHLAALIADNPNLYPETALKLDQGFDYVEIDPDGDIGLVTTGAGLSMQLIDELTARGRRPLNFCDIRTGQFKGDPARLIQVMRWIAAGPQVRTVLINFFAGHTHLGEIARLLVAALDAVPELDVPITARMIGNGLDEARAIVDADGRIAIETDLERAIDLALERGETVDA